ncbi:unnamed protein product [Peniophora sp. CBMAI 1063]|nr:unnamed protein product [Peniophora sp. CBMAI 1063]
MFYSEAILSRRGPLAKVWIAAHMERKLTKQQALQTDITDAVDHILGQEIEMMALRLSGQLLLGVVRIYSRKSKYLYDDCNEALLKIKMAFRPGVVDMTEDQLAANSNAITLQPGGLDLDVLLPDMDWGVDFQDQVHQPHDHHVARHADITLASAQDLEFDLASDAGFENSNVGPSDGLGSQDFLDIDIELPGDENASARGSSIHEHSEDSMSIGVGRDAPARRTARQSMASNLLGGDDLDVGGYSRGASEDFGNDEGMPALDFGDLMAADFGQPEEAVLPPLDEPPVADVAQTPEQTRSRSMSPLTPGPQTPPVVDAEGDVVIGDAEAAPAPEAEAEVTTTPMPKKHKQKQVIDDVTELGRGRARGGLGAQDTSSILATPRYLPRSGLMQRMLEINADPRAHFMPIVTTDQGKFLNAAPPGLAPELQKLFLRPISTHAQAKRRGGSPGKPPSKRQRVESEQPAGPEGAQPEAVDDAEVEQGRRATSAAPSAALHSEAGRAPSDAGLQFSDQPQMFDDYQMDVPFEGADAGLPPVPERAGSRAPSELSRLSTPALEDDPDAKDTYADLECPIAEFDQRGSSHAADTTGVDGKGYSKNTIKALSIIRKELRPEHAGGDEGEKVLSFNQMATKATRRAAAGFFFELLVLGTRDCVKISQPEAYGNIEVTAKPKLWEHQRHASVAGSVAGSVVPSLTSGMNSSQMGL